MKNTGCLISRTFFFFLIPWRRLGSKTGGKVHNYHPLDAVVPFTESEHRMAKGDKSRFSLLEV